MNRDGVSKERQRIRRMFAGIAPRYDLLNHLLSLNADRRWRRQAVRLLDPRPGERVLDLCTGTADLALALARSARGQGPPLLVVGTDFCPEMVRLAARKERREASGRRARLVLAVADSLRLPFRDASFDAVSVAFGLRNLEDLQGGLGEMLRVLRPGGRALILEFTTPRAAWFRALFGFYFHRVLPRIGQAVACGFRRPAPSGDDASGEDSAYSYLPRSVAAWPGPEELAVEMTRAGFSEVRHRLLSLGIAALHLGVKPGGAGRGGGPDLPAARGASP